MFGHGRIEVPVEHQGAPAEQMEFLAERFVKGLKAAILGEGENRVVKFGVQGIEGLNIVAGRDMFHPFDEIAQLVDLVLGDPRRQEPSGIAGQNGAQITQLGRVPSAVSLRTKTPRLTMLSTNPACWRSRGRPRELARG